MMKQMKKLLPVTGAAALAFTALATPIAAQAEVSSSAAIASMYLWRGQDISDHKPAMSGDITYSHDSGAYASLWVSSEGTAGQSYEADVTIGYSGSAGDIGYDVGVYKIWYPETEQKFHEAGVETYVDISYMDYGFKAYVDTKGDKDYSYYTLYGGYEKFSALIGMNDADDDSGDYKHFDISYAATDSLSFTYSKVFSRDDASTLATEPLIMLSYSIPVDMK